MKASEGQFWRVADVMEPCGHCQCPIFISNSSRDPLGTASYTLDMAPAAWQRYRRTVEMPMRPNCEGG
jgi:hypothetical protein